jgi:sulfite reductase beta subunit-like hemoprotein
MNENPNKRVYRLSDELAGDLKQFGDVIAQYVDGRIDADEFNAFRGPRGVVGEKEAGYFMIRNRLPAGMVLPHQLRKIAEVSKKFGDGLPHLTTRQCIQVHHIPLQKLSAAMAELLQAGLSAKDSSGNALRNITACPNAGVCANECFDVTPYAVGLTEFLLTPDLIRKLPRKYKIAVSGCSRDCGGAMVADLGLIARKQNVKNGFSVYVGGGMGAGQRVGSLLEDFVPTSEIHLTAEAIKRVLDKHGDRQNKRKARIRHLVERLGMDAFHALYKEELTAVKNEKLIPPIYSASASPEQVKTDAQSRNPEGFDLWMRRNTQAQKQAGYVAVEIPVKLGDIPAETMIALADVVENFGEKMLRVTPRQNFQLRWVPDDQLASLYQKIRELDLTDTTPSPYRDVISCIGTSTCTRGICFSRGLARAISDHLTADGPELSDLVKFDINISGCSNSCGRHPIADIGLTGVAKKNDGRSVPHYILQLGGHLEEGKTRFAEGKISIPAKAIPAFMKEFMDAFKQSQAYPDFKAFLAADGVKIAESLTEKFTAVPSYDDDPSYYRDCGSDCDFIPGN